MKKLLLVLVAFAALFFCSYGQVPQAFNYQGIIRDANNAILANQVVSLRMSIGIEEMWGPGEGFFMASYIETFSVTTNANGLVNLTIGQGIPVGGNFAEINWGSDFTSWSIKTEVDPTGGSGYTTLGTSPLLSVPYALFSKNAENAISATNAINSTNAISAETAGNGIAYVSISGDSLYFQNGSFIIFPGISASNPSPYAAGSNFCGSMPTAVIEVLSPLTNKIWMDRNLGAFRAANSPTDANAYGYLYQWGRGSDGHQCRNSPTTGSLSSTDQPGNNDFIVPTAGNYDWRVTVNPSLWQGVNGTNNPCPTGYRVPTITELNAERATWSSNSEQGAFSSPLKLTVAGRRTPGAEGGALTEETVVGRLWSSTVDSDESKLLVFGYGNAYLYNYARSYGFSVRCIKN